MEIVDRRIVEYKDGSRLGMIDFTGTDTCSVLRAALKKVHDIGYSIDRVMDKKSDYWDDDGYGYKHHGTVREVSPAASDEFETWIDELFLGGDEHYFFAHMADHHISVNIFEMTSDYVIRLLLDYRAEYTEFSDFFRKEYW